MPPLKVATRTPCSSSYLARKRLDIHIYTFFFLPFVYRVSLLTPNILSAPALRTGADEGGDAGRGAAVDAADVGAVGVLGGVVGVVVEDLDPLDVHGGAAADGHDLGPAAAVGPDVEEEGGRVLRYLIRVLVHHAAVDVPGAHAGAPVVPVRPPRRPRRDRDLVRRVGPRDAARGRRLVRVVRLVRVLAREDLEVGLLDVGVGSAAAVREHGGDGAGGAARARVHAHRQVLVVGRERLDLGRLLEVAVGGRVAVRAHGHVGARGGPRVGVGGDVDVVLGVRVPDRRVGPVADPGLDRPGVGEGGRVEVRVRHAGLGRERPVLDGRRDPRARDAAEVEELVVHQVLRRRAVRQVAVARARRRGRRQKDRGDCQRCGPETQVRGNHGCGSCWSRAFPKAGWIG